MQKGPADGIMAVMMLQCSRSIDAPVDGYCRPSETPSPDLSQGQV
jgi:hypothetical protein